MSTKIFSSAISSNSAFFDDNEDMCADCFHEFAQCTCDFVSMNITEEMITGFAQADDFEEFIF